MIRLRFKLNLDYQRLRYEYVLRAIASHAIALDPEPLLKYIFRGLKDGTPKEWSELKKCLPETWRCSPNNDKNLREIKSSPLFSQMLLNDDGGIDAKKVIELIAGPEQEPKWWNRKQNDFPDACEIRSFLELKAGIYENKSKTEDGKRAKDESILSKIFLYDNLCKNALKMSLENDQRNPFTELFPEYKEDSEGKTISTAYWLIDQIDVITCPYCNLQYARAVPEAKIRPALDHFYPKSVHPQLAVNLFNLIPACSTCNSKKGDDVTSLIYPYEEAFDSIQYGNVPITFTPEPERDLLGVLRGCSTAFKIDFEVPDGETASASTHYSRVNNSINEFELRKTYGTHTDTIKKILRNHYVYSAAGIRERLMLFNEKSDIQGLQESLDTWLNNLLYFGDFSQSQWGNMPLNKLKADIVGRLDYWEILGEELIANSKG